MDRTKRDIIRAALILAGAVCLLTGIMRGEAVRVLDKAVRICLECIGIG